MVNSEEPEDATYEGWLRKQQKRAEEEHAVRFPRVVQMADFEQYAQIVYAPRNYRIKWLNGNEFEVEREGE